MKTILIFVTCWIIGFNAFGQGQGVVSVVYVGITNGLTGSPVPAGTTFLATLYYASPGPDPGDSGMQPSLMMPRGFQAPGSWGTIDTVPTIGNWWVQLRAWEASFGQTYEQALQAPAQLIDGVMRQALVGSSDRSQIFVSTSPPIIPWQREGFTLSVVPEPGTTALVLCGLGALLLLRRCGKKF